MHTKIKRLKCCDLELEDFSKELGGLYENLPNMNNDRLKTILFDFIASQCLDKKDPLKVKK